MSAQPQPIVEQPEPQQPEVKKVRFEWQPTDEQGLPMGGKQVLEYTEGNTQEALDLMAQRNIEIQRELRKVKRDQTLGTVPVQDALPEGLELLDEDPQPLTAEERIRLTNELHDPEKCDAAADRLYRSTPSFRQQQRDVKAVRAFNEARAFAAAHPDFYQCQQNAEALMNWCLSRKPPLAPTIRNFELAFDKLAAAGLLLSAPIAAEEPTRAKTQPEPEGESRITPAEPAPTKRPVKASSGITRDMGQSGPRPADTRGKLSWAAIDRMSETEYTARMKDPEFRKQLDALPPR